MPNTDPQPNFPQPDINNGDWPGLPPLTDAPEDLPPAVEAAYDPEGLSAENNAIAASIHTLVVSFPSGDQRSAAVRELPMLGSFMADQLYIPDYPGTQGLNQFLKEAYDQAVTMVGGEDRAQLYLEYPGLTNDEQLDRVHAVPERWHQVTLDANSSFPQMGTGTRVLASGAILQDLASRATRAEDLVFAYQDRNQIETEKAIVAKLHGNFRADPPMPIGHAHADSTMKIPDARFQGLWRGTTVRAVIEIASQAAAWAEREAGISLPPAAQPQFGPTVTETINTFDAAYADRLDAFFGDDRCRPYIDVLLSMNEAASGALTSQEGSALMRQNLRDLNTRRPSAADAVEVPTDVAIGNLVRIAVEKRVALLEEAGTAPAGLRDFMAEYLSRVVDAVPTPQPSLFTKITLNK